MSVLHGMRRFLLSDPETNATHVDDAVTKHESAVHAAEEEHHNIEDAFEEIYFIMLFMACLWFVGKVSSKLNMPALVGEIIVGIVLGPNLLNFVPEANALIVIGEIGLLLLVLEAGIDVSIMHLKIVGSRGLMVALFGSMLPLGIGTGLAVAFGEPLQSAIAIGACLAPTSMGIALNVLRNGKVLNTPTGQLIIAAAVLDDVIALMLLSELNAMSHPTILRILLPLIISPLFLCVFGGLAVKVLPQLIKKIMIRVRPQYHEPMILLLLFLSTFVLVPTCNYAGSSHLLGAFLAGLMFCTDHTIHHAWSHQIKRIMQWMLRIFFACTIGFAVPIRDFGSAHVVQGGFLFLVAVVGKLLTGFFASPLSVASFFTIAFSMSAWGEFAFILATASFESGVLDKDAYSSVLMAVLLSVVVSPLLLRTTLTTVQHYKQKRLSFARGSKTELHPVYFCIHTKGRGRWGHQDRLLKSLFNLSLEIIDFRAFHEIEDNLSHHLPTVQDVFYVKDTQLRLIPTKRLDAAQENQLHERCRVIKHALRDAILGDTAELKAKVEIMRWLPGVRKRDDVIKLHTKAPPVTYCRRNAFLQARLALEHEEKNRSNNHLSTLARVHTTHDRLHRRKFTFHGDIHSHNTDELIALSFLDTLSRIHQRLSPRNRSRSPSPVGVLPHTHSTDHHNHNNNRNGGDGHEHENRFTVGMTAATANMEISIIDDDDPTNDVHTGKTCESSARNVLHASRSHRIQIDDQIIDTDDLYNQVHALKLLAEKLPQFRELSAESHEHLLDRQRLPSKSHGTHSLSDIPAPDHNHNNHSHSHHHKSANDHHLHPADHDHSNHGSSHDSHHSSNEDEHSISNSPSAEGSHSSTIVSSVMYGDEDEHHQPLELFAATTDHMDGIAEDDDDKADDDNYNDEAMDAFSDVADPQRTFLNHPPPPAADKEYHSEPNIFRPRRHNSHKKAKRNGIDSNSGSSHRSTGQLKKSSSMLHLPGLSKSVLTKFFSLRGHKKFGHHHHNDDHSSDDGHNHGKHNHNHNHNDDDDDDLSTDDEDMEEENGKVNAALALEMTHAHTVRASTASTAAAAHKIAPSTTEQAHANANTNAMSDLLRKQFASAEDLHLSQGTQRKPDSPYPTRGAKRMPHFIARASTLNTLQLSALAASKSVGAVPSASASVSASVAVDVEADAEAGTNNGMDGGGTRIDGSNRDHSIPANGNSFLSLDLNAGFGRLKSSSTTPKLSLDAFSPVSTPFTFTIPETNEIEDVSNHAGGLAFSGNNHNNTTQNSKDTNIFSTDI